MPLNKQKKQYILSAGHSGFTINVPPPLSVFHYFCLLDSLPAGNPCGLWLKNQVWLQTTPTERQSCCFPAWKSMRCCYM